MSYMVDEMPLGGYALGGYALGGEIYGGAKARAAKALKRAVKAKVPAKKLVHQGYEVKVKIADLKSQAKALGIKGYSKMRKFELLKALREHKPRHMVEVEPKKQVKRSAKKTAENLSNKEFSEILQLGDILKMKLAELKKKIKC
jgi:hypothetical protein